MKTKEIDYYLEKMVVEIDTPQTEALVEWIETLINNNKLVEQIIKDEIREMSPRKLKKWLSNND